MSQPRVYDASVAQQWNTLSSGLNKKNEWNFYTQPGVTSFVLGQNLLARKAYDAKQNTELFYIGRFTRVSSCTSVEFSKYESEQIIKIIETIQFQRREQLGQGKSEAAVTLKFNERIISKAVEDTRSLSFWQSPIEKLQSVRIAISFNQVLGQFQLSLNCPVTSEVSSKHKGWPGPTIDLNYLEMDELANLLSKQDM